MSSGDANPASSNPPESLPLAHARELARVATPQWPRYVIGLGVLSYGVLAITAVGTGTFALVEAIPLIALLAFAAHRIAEKIADRDQDPRLTSFVFAAFWAKIAGTLLRTLVVTQLYGNRSDSNDYHRWGQYFAPQFRSFDFSHIASTNGTDFMRTMTGFVYSFTGASEMSGSIVLSFLSFIGLLLLWRAFRRAVPDGAHFRYGTLVLFLPSFLYWPSALGKEGWAIFCLGVASYGVARVLTRSVLPGAAMFAAGLLGVSALRPHVALTMFCGVFLAAAVGKSSRPGVKASSLRLILFGALLIVGLTLASSTASFFGVDRLDLETVNATLNSAEGRTSEAGSSFTPVTMSNPANAPLAIATVLFRPFPFEASSPVSAASAFEGVFLMVLTWQARKRLRGLARQMRRQPYVAYCMGITLTFIFAFSAFSNFGILARQRVQVLPFFLALLCIPVWQREGVVSIEDALAGRVEPARVPLVDGAPSLYSEVTNEGSVAVSGDDVDPYAADPGFDPYERFREPPDSGR